MNHEIIKIHSPYPTLDMQIARQCAPLLTGIKVSNILITSQVHLNSIYETFRYSEIQIKIIYSEAERLTMLLYQPEKLLSYIHQEQILQVMMKLGYAPMELEQILELFTERFEAYRKKMQAFPHELGILLGYPLADVVGFMENGGKNAIYTGYWKVYEDFPEALDTFYQYKRAQEALTYLVSSGVSVKQILRMAQAGKEILNIKQLVAV